MTDEIKKAIHSYNVENSKLEDETKLLKETIIHLKKELDRLKLPPLLVAEVKEVIDDTAILHLKTGNEFLVNVANDVLGLKAGDTVLVEQKNLSVVKIIDATSSFGVEKFVIMEKPKVHWSEVGGLDNTIKEIKEVIELPLNNPKIFEKVGITPPKGILLHGPPGTGKTLLAKAVATATHSTFIEIVGSELVQKFIGEGAKIVKEIFEMAKEKAPCIIFIDELDALAAKRIEQGTSGEREVQRTFMQLLAELDGFKPLGNVKLIATTNRKDILDPAIIRPGRLDRLIHVKNPDQKGIEQIFKIHSKDMNLDKKINMKEIHNLILEAEFSGAEIKSALTEAGYNAIRKKRTKVIEKDLTAGIEKVKEDEEHKIKHQMFS